MLNHSSPARTLRSLALVVILSLFAGTAWSQTVEGWIRKVELAEGRIHAGIFREARSISASLIKEMLHDITGGPGTGPLVGKTLLIRSLGEAGLGDWREALWDWHSARALDPRITPADLATYGAVGQALQKALAEEGLPQRSSDEVRGDSPGERVEGLTRPKKTWGDLPVFPRGLHATCQQGVVILETVIDREGRVASPAPVESPSPVLTLAALETLRTWKFRPARLEDKPVAVYYTLTINFQDPVCRTPAAVSAPANR